MFGHLEICRPIHIQVGANDPLEEAKWVDTINRQTKCWPIAQVAFADLTDKNLGQYLDELLKLKTVKGIRQIIGRAPEEDSLSNINKLLTYLVFTFDSKKNLQLNFSDLHLKNGRKKASF